MIGRRIRLDAGRWTCDSEAAPSPRERNSTARRVKSARTLVIQLQNEDRSDVVWTWKLLRAWPSRYRFTGLDANGKDALIEMLELVVESMEVE